jgi:hypothetical protein
MGRLSDGVTGFLAADGQDFAVQEEADYTLVRFIAEGRQSKQLHTTIICREQAEIVSVYTRFGYDADVPSDKRGAVAEYTARANYGLVIGNFELDMDSGHVRYKTSVDLEGAIIEQVLFKNLIYANLTTADRYYPGLLKVLWGDDMTPRAAIEMVEGD